MICISARGKGAMSCIGGAGCRSLDAEDGDLGSEKPSCFRILFICTLYNDLWVLCPCFLKAKFLLAYECPSVKIVPSELWLSLA
jgi:hypothetical protein